MKIILQPGDILTVNFADTDGEFKIHFDSTEYPKTVTVEETDGLPDTDGPGGIVYQERFETEKKTDRVVQHQE